MCSGQPVKSRDHFVSFMDRLHDSVFTFSTFYKRV